MTAIEMQFPHDLHYFEHPSLMSVEKAERLQRAAEEVGGIAVEIISREGEDYVHRHDHKKKPFRGTVPKGEVYAKYSGSSENMDQFHRRADELAEAEQVKGHQLLGVEKAA